MDWAVLRVAGFPDAGRWTRWPSNILPTYMNLWSNFCNMLTVLHLPLSGASTHTFPKPAFLWLSSAFPWVLRPHLPSSVIPSISSGLDPFQPFSCHLTTFLLLRNSVSYLLFKSPRVVSQFTLLSAPYLIFHPKRVICVKDTWNRFQTNLTSWEDLGSSLLTSVQIAKNPRSKRARN